jgi:hypothetical protein
MRANHSDGRWNAKAAERANRRRERRVKAPRRAAKLRLNRQEALTTAKRSLAEQFGGWRREGLAWQARNAEDLILALRWDIRKGVFFKLGRSSRRPKEERGHLEKTARNRDDGTGK